VKSSLTVIGYPKLARADASDALAPYIQTRQPARNRRQSAADAPGTAVRAANLVPLTLASTGAVLGRGEAVMVLRESVISPGTRNG
jgi:hypothetical protein